jgi:hypothetical protein
MKKALIEKMVKEKLEKFSSSIGVVCHPCIGCA